MKDRVEFEGRRLHLKLDARGGGDTNALCLLSLPLLRKRLSCPPTYRLRLAWYMRGLDTL